jgi:NADH-quinone oxidoreductase subunit L
MQLWLIPILPLAGFVLNGVLGRRLSKSAVNAIAVGSVLLSFLWVLKTLIFHLDPVRLAEHQRGFCH